MTALRPARGWTTTAEVRAEVERLWERGLLPSAVLHRETGAAHALQPDDASQQVVGPPVVFPLRLRLRRPRPSELSGSFAAVRDWIADLEAGSRARNGGGFDIAWEEINNRQLGRNRLPMALTLPTLDEALVLIGKRGDADRLAALSRMALMRLPGLAAWLLRRPLAVLEHEAAWPRLLDCVAWFVANPRSGLYARQVDIAGVDSKFIEGHKVVLSDLVDAVRLRGSGVPPAGGTAGFEARFGLAARPALVRLRALDPRLAIQGFTDLTVRIDELAASRLRPRRVVIVENDITGLAFPPLEGGLLIFGRGHAVEQLAGVAWLCDCPIDYWGDIDTNGLAILARTRAMFPQARSLLMDRATLLAHRAAWTIEPAPHVGDLAHLTSEEAALYDDLRRDRLGAGIRLEQERIPMSLLPPL